MTTKHGELYDRPAVVGFNKNSFQDLQRHLRAVDRNSTISPIADPEELMLGRDGRTKRGGYRYTASSFRKVTQYLAAGLSTLLSDLGGETRRTGVTDSMLDGHQARVIFNNMIQLRFELLAPYRLLRNEQDKTIDGVVGQKHRSLENITMLEFADSAVSSREDIAFYQAGLLNRRLVLWYRARQPMFVKEINERAWRFFHGYYFRNSESTGTSVCGGLTIFTRRGACLSPFTKDTRVTHIGRDFTHRLNKMFQNVLGAETSPEKYSKCVDQLLETPLRYAELTDNEQRETYHRRFCKGLENLGMPQKWASEIFDKTMRIGSKELDDLQHYFQPQLAYGDKTQFDIICPIMSMAKGLPLNKREAVEQVAFKVLNGQFEM